MASRDHALDGLRGLAALSVAGGHSILTLTGIGIWGLTVADFGSHPFKETVFRLGYLVAPSDAAVMVFFVLSGHVLWAMFDRRYWGIESLPLCLAERLWRLLPVSIAAGLLIGAVAQIGYYPPIDAAELWRTMFILSRNTNGVLWSLQVEVIASILLFIVWAVTRGRSLAPLLFIVPSLLIYDWMQYEWALYLPAFLLGAATRTLPERIAQSPLMIAAGVLLLVASSILLGHEWRARLFETTGAFLIVCYARAVQPRWLTNRAVQFLGLVSYPFYLVHGVGIGFAFRHMAFVPPSPMANRVLVLFVLSTLTALAIAYILHRLVERPAMRLRLPELAKTSKHLGEQIAV